MQAEPFVQNAPTSASFQATPPDDGLMTLDCIEDILGRDFVSRLFAVIQEGYLASQASTSPTTSQRALVGVMIAALGTIINTSDSDSVAYQLVQSCNSDLRDLVTTARTLV